MLVQGPSCYTISLSSGPQILFHHLMERSRVTVLSFSKLTFKILLVLSYGRFQENYQAGCPRVMEQKDLQTKLPCSCCAIY